MPKKLSPLMGVAVLLVTCAAFVSQVLAVSPPARIASLPGLTRPVFIQLNDQYIYISEVVSTMIFSRKDFKPVKSFGTKGEGPREFKGYALPYIGPDSIFVNSMNKVSYFTLDGEFIKERKTQFPYGRFRELGDRFVGYHYSRQGDSRTEAIYLFNRDFEKTRQLYTREHWMSKGQIKIVEERPPFFYIHADRIFLDGEDGVIRIYDFGGKEVGAIRYDYPRVAFTREHKQKFLEHLSTNPDTKAYFEQIKDRLRFPDYFPPIRMYHVADDRVYVMTNREKGHLNQFVVFQLTRGVGGINGGKLLKTVYLPVSSYTEGMIPLHYTISGGELYKLVENPDTEEWELHILNI